MPYDGRTYQLARVLQGEAGSYAGQVAVANVIGNRAASGSFPGGADPLSVAYAPGQFIGRAAPTAQSLGIAERLLGGSLADTTGGARYFVSRAPGAAYNGVLGATGPATAGIISGGRNIGGNYFSDRWGGPSRGYLAGGPSNANLPIAPGSFAGRPGLGGGVALPPGLGGDGQKDFGGLPDPLAGKATAQIDANGKPVSGSGGSILSGIWEYMGVTATTTAGKTTAEGYKEGAKEVAKATKEGAELQAKTEVETSGWLTTTLSNIASATFGNLFNLFGRGAAIVVGLVVLAGAIWVAASGKGGSIGKGGTNSIAAIMALVAVLWIVAQGRLGDYIGLLSYGGTGSPADGSSGGGAGGGGKAAPGAGILGGIGGAIGKFFGM